MKARVRVFITSNWRSLPRALCTLFLCMGALWAMPGSARAQLYVGQYGSGIIGEYNATTGAPINANLITGLDGPIGFLLSGNHFSWPSGRRHGWRIQR